MSSVDPTLSDLPTVDELTADLEAAVDTDGEVARDAVLALLGVADERDLHLGDEDSFKRQLGYRLRLAKIRRTEDGSR
ncbi:hypothetical protein ACYJ1Y_16055 [Natrialbaceae archaeon A-gly3]